MIFRTSPESAVIWAVDFFRTRPIIQGIALLFSGGNPLIKDVVDGRAVLGQKFLPLCLKSLKTRLVFCFQIRGQCVQGIPRRGELAGNVGQLSCVRMPVIFGGILAKAAS